MHASITRSPGKPGFSPDHNSLARTVEQNLADYWLTFAGCPGGEMSENDPAIWEYSGTAFFNRVVHARFEDRDANAQIQRIAGVFRSRRAAITWLVGPSSEPADLGSRLERVGFSRVDTWIGMAHRFERKIQQPSQPSDLIVRTVQDDDTCNDWVRVVRSSFGLPRRTSPILKQQFIQTQRASDSNWVNMVAYRGHVPVAAVTLLVTDHSAGIYLVATVPGARRNGLGSYMTWLALEKARELDCHLVVLQASAEGRQIYERLGFVPVCRFGVYRLPAPRPRWKRAALVLMRRVLASTGLRGRFREKPTINTSLPGSNGRPMPAVGQCARSQDL